MIPELIVNNNYNPVAVFTYNRPGHAGRLFSSLERCPDLDYRRIHIFCDGPKSEADEINVTANRLVVNSWAGKVGARVIERDINYGLADSILDGVCQLCDSHGQVIVLEDDLVVSPDFIHFMDEGLTRYKNENRIFQISGYNFPINRNKQKKAFFIPLTTSWGWATWKRAWDRYSCDTGGILTQPERLEEFDLQGSYPFSEILESTLAGDTDSWAIYWRLSVYLAGGLVLYPPRSLVWQGGFDGSGVHCGTIPGKHGIKLPPSYCEPRLPPDLVWPFTVSESSAALEQIKEHLRNHHMNKYWASESSPILHSLFDFLNRIRRQF